MPTCTKGSKAIKDTTGLSSRVIPAPTLIKAETSLCFFLHKFLETAVLTPEGNFGQVLTAGSGCGWMLWQDAGFCPPSVLRTAPGPMQGTQAWHRKIHSKVSAHRALSKISFSLFQ